MSVVYCRKCSAIIPDHAQFCSVCGASLSIQSDHPTLLMGPIDQKAADTGATALADLAPVERDFAASISSILTERDPSVPPDVMGLADKSLTVAAHPTYATSPAELRHENDTTPTMPGILAQFDQATNPSGVRSAQPELVQREQWLSEVAGAQQRQPIEQPFLPQQSNPAPIQYSRHGTIDSRKHNQKSFLRSSRYFFIGTGLLLLIGIVALITYPYLVKGKIASATTTAAYAQPAIMPAPTPQTMATPVATSRAVATPVPTSIPATTRPAGVYAGLMPTPTVTSAPPVVCLHVDQAALNFSATSGGNAPAPQTIMLSNVCAGAWSVRWDTSWLRANPVYNSAVHGATPVVITVSSVNLAPNSYTGHIIFSTGSSQAKVAVTLTVAQPTPTITSCIKLDQNSLNFSATPQQNPASQVIMVTNCGSAGTVTATVSTSYTSSSPSTGQSNQSSSMQHNNGTNWLTTSSGGQLAAGNTLPLHVNVTTLKPGVYTSSIVITITTSAGKTDAHTVNVTFTVQGSQAASN